MSVFQAPSSVSIGGDTPAGPGYAPGAPAMLVFNPLRYLGILLDTGGSGIGPNAPAPASTMAAAGGALPFAKGHMLPILGAAVGIYLLERKRQKGKLF